MLQDLRFAWRLARKNPASSLASFAALALAIGATSAIFSVLSGVMLRPLPVKDGSRLVRIFSTDSRSDEDDVSLADYLDWKKQQRSFSDMALFRIGQTSLTGQPIPERVVTGQAEWNLFRLLGIAPLSGRDFSHAENEPGQSGVVLLTRSFWQTHFAGQPVNGKRLVLDDKTYTIIGVLPPSVSVLGPTDVWIPLLSDGPRAESQRGFHSYKAIARLNPRIGLAAANAELQSMAAALAGVHPNDDAGVGTRAVPLADAFGQNGRPSMHASVRSALLMLFGAVLCVLLIACGNVANIMLARAWSRQRETAVRLAIGAPRSRLVRQMLSEGLVISVPAALFGLALAAALVHLFRTLPLTNIPRLEEISVDWRVLLFTTLTGLASGSLVGLLTAFRTGSLDLVATLKQSGGRTTESRGQQSLRRFFVGLQVAFTVVLLVESSLLARSFLNAEQVKPSFASDNLLTLYLALPDSRYGVRHPEDVEPLMRNVLERLRSIPGVLSAGVTSDLPLMASGGGGGVFIEGTPRPKGLWDAPYALYTDVSPRYFHTLGVAFRAGGDFDERDARLGNLAIVNTAFARRFFPGQSPVGRRISLSAEPSNWKQVVGVVADVPQMSIEKAPLPEIFLPAVSVDLPWLAIAVRVQQDPARYINAIRRAVALADPGVAVFLPRTMDEIIGRQYVWRRLETWIVGTFATLAVTLAALGISAALAYTVAQRRSEIGVRLALGATAPQILRLVLWQGMAPALVGGAAGLAAGYAAARLTSRLLFNVTATDGATYLSVVCLLVGLPAAAAYLPARRATAIEPWKALRDE